MFERTHHRRIAQVLTLLDGDALRKQQCWFGGGTACALLHGEYRESVDVDFLVSDVGCYRALRQLLTGPRGVLELMPPEQELVVQIKDVRADRPRRSSCHRAVGDAGRMVGTLSRSVAVFRAEGGGVEQGS